MTDGKNSTIRPPRRRWAVLAFIFIAAAMAANYWYANLDSAQRGTFGDLFGAVNALFSGLAFVGLVYAILIQRYEVRIARSELDNANAMFREQQEALRVQNGQAKRQAFESTFFQLLSLLTDITAAIGVPNGRHGGTSYGKDAFPILIRELRARFPHEAPGVQFHEGYENFYEQYGPNLGHYFRTVYNILKFIDHSNIQDKKFYTNILRAQISDVEAALLLHNAVSRFGAEKFQPLALRYELFKNVRDGDLVSPNIRGMLPVGAVGA